MKPIALLLLLAQSAPAQESDAEKLFRQMEEKLMKAKTVQFSAKGENKGSGESTDGTYLLAEDAKLRIETSIREGGKKYAYLFVSDGKRLDEFKNDQKRQSVESPAELNSILKLALARTGVEMMLNFRRLSGKEEASRRLPVSGFKSGGREKLGETETDIVEYDIEIPNMNKASGKVWIDRKKSLPHRFILVVTRNDQKSTLTSEYTGFKIDDPIDEAKFKLP